MHELILQTLLRDAKVKANQSCQSWSHSAIQQNLFPDIAEAETPETTPLWALDWETLLDTASKRDRVVRTAVSAHTRLMHIRHFSLPRPGFRVLQIRVRAYSKLPHDFRVKST